jgi:hypothetical protein
MGLRKRMQQFGSTRIISAIVAALGLLFLVAFGAKVLEAYRLRNWRQRLQVEVMQLERKQADWQSEVQRRQSTAWVEEELNRMGMVRDDQVSIVAVVVTSATTMTVSSGPVSVEPISSTVAVDAGLFRNTNWRAWQRLIRGFD